MTTLPKNSDESIYPVITEIFEDFLSTQGFRESLIAIGKTFHKTKDKKSSVEVPQTKQLTKDQVNELLELGNLKMETFEEYIKHIKETREFEFLVQQSLRPDTLKK